MVECNRAPADSTPNNAEADLIAESEEEEHAESDREKRGRKKSEKLDGAHKPLFKIVILTLEIKHEEEEEKPYGHNDRSGKKGAEPIFCLTENKIKRIEYQRVSEWDNNIELRIIEKLIEK